MNQSTTFYIGIKAVQRGTTLVWLPMSDDVLYETHAHKDGTKTVIWYPGQKWITVLSHGARTHLRNSRLEILCTGLIGVRSSCSVTYRVSIDDHLVALECVGSSGKE